MKKSKILLIGCGELGSRHLQAAASLPNIGKIYVFDPSAEALKMGQSRLKEIEDLNKDIVFEWFNKISKVPKDGDLCIIATQANVRVAMLKQAAEEFKYKKFFIEKIVSQSVEEYEDLLLFCEKNEVDTWVNCKERAYGVHKYIKSRLNPNESMIFNNIGGNHGLANNGIHTADLFSFYDECKEIVNISSKVEPVLFSSKRGKDIFDLSGILCGCSEKGSDLMISFAKDHDSPDTISITSASGRFIIDHFQKFAFESYPESDWQWKKINLDENWNVSHMSKRFITDILTKETCDLPILKECYPAHKFILGGLLPSFNKLLRVNNNYCPVT